MLDIKFIRDNQEVVKKAIQDKQLNVNLDHLISLDDQRRKLIVETEAIRSRRNEIAQTLKKGKDDKLVKEGKKLKESSAKFELELKEIQDQWLETMRQVPNVPLPDVPVGKDETENEVVKKVGKPKNFDFEIKDHLQLGADLNVLDMERASKVAGARFGYWKGGMAQIELALTHHVFKILTNSSELEKIARAAKLKVNPKPFIPVFPPVMIKPEVYKRTTRLTEADKEDKFYINSDDKYLIGSAEHTLVPMHMDETLKEESLPIRYAAISTAFRREAGSYGKDTKGMIRVHQFDKIEMESFTKPEDGLNEHLFLVATQEYIMQSLDLAYQVVLNCTGDMAKPDARQMDLETWIPSQGRYRETHSADYVTNYQARSLNIRFRKKDGTTEYVHTNDATAIAMPRTLVAIMENNQQKDGSVKVPKVLQEYIGFDTIKKS
ncbi:MAG: serine--tRNA ligase [Candidatus Doudnabacteria bacterium]|nr:serine--tRNA ligase [Candidatus Doudnabacteria bacterium]